MVGKSVREFVDEWSRFSFSDPFGMGRLRELAYSYKMKELDMEGENERLRAMFEQQAHVVDMLVTKQLDLEKRNEQLSSYISQSDEAKRSLNEKKLLAEADRQRMSGEYRQMCEETERLKDIETRYIALSARYETLMAALRDAKISVPVCDLETEEVE